MFILIILFFISLAGISIMIGRKLVLLRKGQITVQGDFSIQPPDPHQIRFIIIRNTKKYGYILLVATIRFSMKSSRIVKSKYEAIKNKTKNITRKYIPHKEKEIKEKEVSKFLKMVTEYTHKIRKIKHKIKEEENL